MELFWPDFALEDVELDAMHTLAHLTITGSETDEPTTIKHDFENYFYNPRIATTVCP